MCLCIHIHKHIHMHTHTPIHTYTYTHTYIYTYTHIHIHIYIYTYIFIFPSPPALLLLHPAKNALPGSHPYPATPAWVDSPWNDSGTVTATPHWWQSLWRPPMMEPLSLVVQYVLLEKLSVLKDILVFLEIPLVLAKMFITLNSLTGKWFKSSQDPAKEVKRPKERWRTDSLPPSLKGNAWKTSDWTRLMSCSLRWRIQIHCTDWYSPLLLWSRKGNLEKWVFWKRYY